MRISDWSSDVCSSDLAYYSHGGYGFVDGAWQNINPSLGTEFQPMQLGELGDFTSHDYSINDRLSIKATFGNFSFETAGTLNLDFYDETNFRPTEIGRAHV